MYSKLVGIVNYSTQDARVDENIVQVCQGIDSGTAWASAFRIPRSMLHFGGASNTSVEGAPQAHVGQAKRDRGDSELPALHSKDRFALENGRALLLQLRHAREVAVCAEAQQGAASCQAISKDFCLSSCL